MPKTHGQLLVEALLKKLPKEYFWKAEPWIGGARRNGRGAQNANERPDFVIAHRKFGIVVIEVKDWRNILEATQEEFLIQLADGEERRVPNPIVTARNYTFNLMDKLTERQALRHQTGQHQGKLSFPCVEAVIMTHMDYETVVYYAQNHIWDEKKVLGSEMLMDVLSLEQALNGLPRPFRVKEPLSRNVMDEIRGVLDPHLIVRDADGKDRGTLTPGQEREVKRSLTAKDKDSKTKLAIDVQEIAPAADTVEFANVSIRLLRGVAGSGKSLVLRERALHIAKRYPEASILILTFSEDLAKDHAERVGNRAGIEIGDFQRTCRGILGDRWEEPLSVEAIRRWVAEYTLHTLSKSGLSLDFIVDEIAYRKDLELHDNKIYLEAERSGREIALKRPQRAFINEVFQAYQTALKKSNNRDWSDVPEFTLKYLKAGHPDYQRYDVILIDEAQDFAPTWMRVVKALLNPNGHLFMADDPNQSVFRNVSWKQKGIEVTGRTKVLRVPFRSSRAISVAAHSLILGDPLLSQSGDTVKVDLDTYTLEEGDKPLLVTCAAQSQEIRFINEQIKQLREDGLATNHIAILCAETRMTSHWSRLAAEGVYVRSFRHMKGLEFDAVFLPHINGLFQQPGQELDENNVAQFRRRLYTAMTRAKVHLVLTYSGDYPAELALLNPHVQRVRFAG